MAPEFRKGTPPPLTFGVISFGLPSAGGLRRRRRLQPARPLRPVRSRLATAPASTATGARRGDRRARAASCTREQAQGRAKDGGFRGRALRLRSARAARGEWEQQVRTTRRAHVLINVNHSPPLSASALCTIAVVPGRRRSVLFCLCSRLLWRRAAAPIVVWLCRLDSRFVTEAPRLDLQ